MSESESLTKCDVVGKFSANGRTRLVRNQFSAEEHMRRNLKIRYQFSFEVSVNMWKLPVRSA